MSISPGPLSDADVASSDAAHRSGRPDTSARPPTRGLRRVLRRDLGVDRLSGVYVLVVLIVAFSIWEPATFATVGNFKAVLASEAITGIVTMGVVIALIAGVFDLSVAANMSLAVSLVGVLQANLGINWVLAVLITLAVGGLVGVLNAVVVTKLGIEPVIGTLAMSSILAAVTYWIADGQTILDGIDPDFIALGSAKPLGIALSVYCLLVVGLLLWYVLDHTPVGRYLYAAGANAQAARLSGVNVIRLQWGALITSGVLAALAGVVLTMQLGSASFGAGLPYLLPAFAAAFLGATQIKPGRFNVLGTVVALYLLAVGVKGLQLQFPQFSWIKDLVEGLILLVAVGVAVRSARRRALRA